MTCQQLGPDDITQEQRRALIGRVIKDNVTIVTAPTWHDGEWRCLANVDGALCVIEVMLWKEEAC